MCEVQLRMDSESMARQAMPAMQNVLLGEAEGAGEEVKITKEQLKNLYISQNLSIRKCAEALGWPTSGGISWWLKKFGIPARPGKFQVGNRKKGDRPPERNGNWKGGKKTVICSNCGKQLKRFPSHVHEQNFCSHHCKAKWQRQDLTGKQFGLLTVIKEAARDQYKHFQWECRCECGGRKVVRTGDLLGDLVKSCGCLLLVKGEKHHAWKGGLAEVKCANPGCNKTKLIQQCSTRSYEKHLCSQECHGAYRSTVIRGENHPKWKPRIDTVCAFCGEPLTITSTRKRLYAKSFCNVDCQGKWISKNKAGSENASWRGGISFEPYPTTWNFRLREAIRDRDGRECQVCGKAENGERLAVHHINYEKKNVDPENLIALCHTCHCKTVTNRDKWRAFFEEKRDGLQTGTDN